MNILYQFSLFCLLALGSVIIAPQSQAAAPAEIVEYRLTKWKTVHAHGDEAEKLVETLKKMKCEVKVSSHDDHTDVSYRCEKWHRIELKDHATAHQWEEWLKKRGFETKHTH